MGVRSTYSSTAQFSFQRNLFKDRVSRGGDLWGYFSAQSFACLKTSYVKSDLYLNVQDQYICLKTYKCKNGYAKLLLPNCQFSIERNLFKELYHRSYVTKFRKIGIL